MGKGIEGSRFGTRVESRLTVWEVWKLELELRGFGVWF